MVKSKKFIRLRKVSYGLKWALRSWNMRINSFFKQSSFNKCSCEHRLYVKTDKNLILIICLYANDLLLIENNNKEIKNLRTE